MAIKLNGERASVAGEMSAPGSECSKQNFIPITHLSIIFFYGMAMTWPAWWTGYIPGHDILIHLWWAKNFSDQLWSGELYPRWLSGMNAGLGSPVYFYYAPLPYYITAAFKVFLGGDPEGWRQIGFSATLAIVLSGLTAYIWLRELTSARAALVAAVVYMGAPYHLSFDLFERFAFAELWSFVWLPLVMLMAHALSARWRYAVVGFSLSEAALILTHLPITLIFTIVPIVYVIVFSEVRERLRNFALVLFSMALAIGLAGAYLIPALTTQGYVSFDAMRNDYFFYGYNFLYYGPRFDDKFSALIESLGECSALMMFAILLGCVLNFKYFSGKKKRESVFFVWVALFAFSMMLPIAKPIWDVLPILQAIQFPWRFNVVLALVFAVSLAFWVWSVELRLSKIKIFLLLIACLAVIGQSLPVVAAYYVLSLTPGAASLNKMSEQFGTRSAKTLVKIEAAKLSMDVPEYRPRWTSLALLGDYNKLKNGVLGGDKIRADGSGAVGSVRTWLPRRIDLTCAADQDTWFTIHQLYYPGWSARVTDSSVRLPLRPSTPDGLVQVLVPAGVNDISLRLEIGFGERLGQLISLMSVAVLFAYAIKLKVRFD